MPSIHAVGYSYIYTQFIANYVHTCVANKTKDEFVYVKSLHVNNTYTWNKQSIENYTHFILRGNSHNVINIILLKALAS